MNEGKYFIINDKGKTTACNGGGKLLNRWVPYKSGFMSSKERMQRGKHEPDLAFEVPRYTREHIEAQKAYYTPQGDKFEGYYQMARPLVAPYQN